MKSAVDTSGYPVSPKGERKTISQDLLREKVFSKGISELTDVEVLSTILSASKMKEADSLEVAAEILEECDGKISNLAKMSLNDLQRFRGIGEAKAIAILGSLELGKRKVFQKVRKSNTYRNAESVYELIKHDLMDKIFEEFWVVMLNNSYRLIKKLKISSGGISSTIVDPRLVFKAAVEGGAVRMVLVHNHPSGDAFPSKNDIDVTKKLVEGAKYLDIIIMDHIIVAGMSYFSFADDNLIFNVLPTI